MESIIESISSLKKNQKGEYILSDIIVTDDDIKCLLKNKTPIQKNILFYACYIYLCKTTNKEFLRFIKEYKIKGCEIFTGKSSKLNKEIYASIDYENIVYKLSFLDAYLKTHNHSLEHIKPCFLKKLVFKNVDLSKVDLTYNYDFFQTIKKKKLENVCLPPIDFRLFNIDEVEFLDCKFSEGTIFPYNFFQRIKNKKLVGCSLPTINFTNIDINDTTFMFIKFSSNTIFPNDTTFFKKFNLLYACSLPSYNYKEYLLDTENINYCIFRGNSLMPTNYKLNKKNISNKHPKSFIKLLHIVPIKDLNYDDVMQRYGKYLNEEQKVIIYFKLKDKQDLDRI